MVIVIPRLHKLLVLLEAIQVAVVNDPDFAPILDNIQYQTSKVPYRIHQFEESIGTDDATKK